MGEGLRRDVAEVLAVLHQAVHDLERGPGVADRDGVAELVLDLGAGGAEEGGDHVVVDLAPPRTPAWSRSDSASRALPSAWRAIAAAAESVSVTPSAAATVWRCCASCSMVMRRKSNRWHRPTIVAGILWGSVVARTKRTPGGGSSKTFSSASKASRDEALRLVDDVDLLAAHRRGRRRAFAELAGVLDAAVRGRVDLHDVEVLALAHGQALLHTPQGSAVGPCSQLTIFARIRAVEVFPVPRGPQNRNAWWRRSSRIAPVTKSLSPSKIFQPLS